MAEKRRYFDIWIVESNTVYREVPYDVVTDWLQQGRLLVDDKARASGTAEWLLVGSLAQLQAFLPQAEPFRPDDEAEALEPVEMDLQWRRSAEEEDDDVDMIPLIDVSLVLLVFFIMTTTGAVMATSIPTPAALHGWKRDDSSMLWVGIDFRPNQDPVYSLGEGEKPPASPEDQGLTTLSDVMTRLDARIEERGRAPTEVLVRAHPDLPSGIVRKLQIELEKRRLVVKKYYGVSESKGP